jgi:hypothetical protein
MKICRTREVVLKCEKPRRWYFLAFLSTTDFTGVVMSDYIVVHGVRIAKEFVPETFGRLTTLGPKFRLPVGNKNESKPYQVCECTCGAVKVVDSGCLKSGNTRSCGCLFKQALSESRTKHGLRESPEYEVFYAMKGRCTNPRNGRFSDYGGRGIRICDRWLDPDTGFVNFYADMGPRPSDNHSIDRIDNDGDYCPENCRWITVKEQSRNCRSNVMLTYNGKTQCQTDWAEELGIPRKAIARKLKAGCTVEEAFTKEKLK